MTNEQFAAAVSSLTDLAIDARRRADGAAPPEDLPEHLRQWWDIAVNAITEAEAGIKLIYSEMREFA